MALKDEYNFENLVNEAENLVIEEMDVQLALAKNAGVCRCQDCILDMAAFALNSLSPLYRVSLMGRLYAEGAKRTPFVQDVSRAVEAAIQKVITNPSHHPGG
ncbi:MAG: late competence development ComFB family protein [Spirochaetales bacterium]|jgi:competence protein ComFB|nr:late competence development ComFB family protein [Spirochaetales bacterium]